MSEHKVTEEITQTGGHVSAKIFCSCGIVVESDTRKTSLRALRASITKLHKIAAEDSPKPRKEKKSKKPGKQKPAVEPVTNEYGDDDFATPVAETEPKQPTEPDLELNEDWPDEDTDKS